MRAKADPEAAPAAPPSAGVLRAKALRYLAAREHTRHELHTKLARFCPDQALIEQVLSELEGHGLQDDTRAAHALVRARAARLGVGRLRIELQRRGDSPEVAQQALQQATTDTEHVRAQRLWRKRFGEVAPDPATRAKQWRFLIGRGFAPDVVQAVLRAAARDPAA